jgi:hypothetical protein
VPINWGYRRIEVLGCGGWMDELTWFAASYGGNLWRVTGRISKAGAERSAGPWCERSENVLGSQSFQFSLIDYYRTEDYCG